MAYDRNDGRGDLRDERSRWRDERFEDRDRGSGRDERGFFERAGDEISSWFGDDDAERRRRNDQRMEGRDRGWPRDDDRERFFGRERGRFERDEDRGSFGRARGNEPERGYRPLAGDSTRGDPGDFRWREREREDRGERSFGSRHDPHYQAWRQRQLDELDRDYDDYRRENQARFESDFGSWRERRMQKRRLLGQVREQMEVVGTDDQHVGTVDRVAGDRLVLAKSDPESGGVHHSLSCADIDRVDGDRVVLECSAEQARERWRDESRSRALFEREDQGEMGDRVLDRSFKGTYR